MRLQRHCYMSSSFAVPKPSLSSAQNGILKMGCTLLLDTEYSLMERLIINPQMIDWACSPMVGRSSETLPTRVQILVLAPFHGFILGFSSVMR
jgi:hypothetical protein